MSHQELQSLSNFELFHRLWSKAVDAPRYDKGEWMELEGRLFRLNFLNRDESGDGLNDSP